MKIRTVQAIGWVTVIIAPISLIAGHLGNHNLSWIENHVSTFAAQAPNDYLVTASMIFSAISLGCIGVLFSLCSHGKGSLLNPFCTMLFGTSAAGLVLLARYEETATTIHQLKRLGFNAIRVQSFHDAGLLLFFYCAIGALITSGVTFFVQLNNLKGRVFGVSILLLGLLAFFLMALQWPKFLGFDGSYLGIKQRGAFLCLLIGALIILSLKSGFKTKHLS